MGVGARCRRAPKSESGGSTGRDAAGAARGIDRDGIEVELGRLGRVRVGLRGRHQAANVAVADATLDALESAGIAPSPGRRAGPGTRRFAGRGAARAGRGPGTGREILLDGAHNPAGAATLAAALDEMAPFLRPGRPTLVLAIMADKDVDGVIGRWPGRRSCGGPGRLHRAGGRPGAAGGSPGGALGGARGAAAEAVAEPAAALDAALSPGRRPRGPGGLVVAGVALPRRAPRERYSCRIRCSSPTRRSRTPEAAP
jgi:hypothetical protein